MHTCDKESAVVAGVLVFKEIKHLTKTDKLDPSAVEHVQLALKTRLKILCSRIFDYDESTSRQETFPKILINIINLVPELAFCLPPRHRQGFVPYFVPATPLDLSACLERRSDSSDNSCDDRQIDSCCCGWAFDSIPPVLRNLFGHSARSFAHCVHSGPQKLLLGGEELAFDIRQAMNEVFGGPWSDNSSLRKSTIVFASILSVLLWQLFERSNYETEELINREMLSGMFRSACLTEYYRPRFFVHLLRSAVVMYHEFWNLDRESETDAENSGVLWNHVYVWALERPDFGRGDFLFGVSDILIRRMLVEMTGPDPDLSSGDATNAGRIRMAESENRPISPRNTEETWLRIRLCLSRAEWE